MFEKHSVHDMFHSPLPGLKTDTDPDSDTDTDQGVFRPKRIYPYLDLCADRSLVTPDRSVPREISDHFLINSDLYLDNDS